MFRNFQFVKKHQADIYHITGDVHYVAMALPRHKTIVTIHDCVFLEDAKGAKKWLFKKMYLDWPVGHAAMVTTISEKTKQDIIRFTQCAAEKVHVIHNPVSSSIYYKQKTFNTARPTILFLGTKDHKNLPRAVEALKDIPCDLEVIGRIPKSVQDQLYQNSIAFSQFENLSDEQVSDRYYNADVVLFPSLYEGFGLPVTEGNKAGRVVVTSNISPMKEIAKGAACLVDPYSVQSIRNGILKVIEDEDYRKDCIAKGFENIKRFEPEYIASQYVALYKKLHQQNNVAH